MKRILALILLSCLILSACGQKIDANTSTDVPTWQEQYDLGIRYLSEGNYEEAILAFTTAIEIDPRKSDAYRKAAEAYENMGDNDSAIAILERGVDVTGDETLKALLEEKTGTSEDVQVSPEGIQLTLSLTDLNLQESYLINKVENQDDDMEYCWFVCFNDGTNFYEVGTSYFKYAGDVPRYVTLHEMQSNLWVRKAEGDGFTWATEAELSINGTTLSWAFTIPAEYSFDLEHMEVTGTVIEAA